ncbi:semaphorin-4A [Betta splendens]|uniref:Semaphorin-4A n=1 Tax=Betta splendens TaxID=158456 RepID=A0A6P7KYZ6_BETSP|nr:semaphorin-4A [Betta splendens]
MTPAGAVLLLGLLGSVSSLMPPRTSFLLNSTDRPLVQFSLRDLYNTTTLLLSDDGSTLYVGARDAILSLDVSQSDTISLKNQVEWSPTESDKNICVSKGKKREVHCSNFIRVLQPMNSTHLYVCGSYAYGPQEAWLDTAGQNLSVVPLGTAKGRCPFSPFQRSVALSVDGEVFTASTSDFRGTKPEIARHFSKDGRPDVLQDLYGSLLEEPEFVGSSLDPAENKLYFFFSEVGKEFSYTNELRVARVAQVCKDDVGGQRTLQRKWTSFTKSSLVCQVSRRLPFNVLQDVFTLQLPDAGGAVQTRFYSVFTSQWSSGPESAVCVFNLQDIRDVFKGNYRTFDSRNHLWVPMKGKHSYLGKCGLENATDAELNEVKKTFLTSRSVAAAGNGPVVVSSDHIYSRIAAMTTEALDGKRYTVLFLLTESGFLHKLVLFNTGPRIIEEVQVFREPQLVKSLLLSSSKGVVYVGTSGGVTAVPLANCSVYRTCSQCVLARDPLCGWSPSRRACTGLDSSDPLTQDLDKGNVKEKCPRASTGLDLAHTDVTVRWGESVRLRCVSPSNLATLTWTGPPSSTGRTIQAADGGLSFLASADTVGRYRCVAEEAGHADVVAAFEVQLMSPRSVRPGHGVSERVGPSSTEEPYEDVETAEPPADPDLTVDGAVTNSSTHGTAGKPEDFGPSGVQNHDSDLTTASSNDTHSGKEALRRAQSQKSYFSELVAVSLLLVVVSVCVLLLGGLQMWWRSRTGRKASAAVGPEHKPTESIPSLSPEDADTEPRLV